MNPFDTVSLMPVISSVSEITLTELKEHLRIEADVSDEDPLLDSYLSAAVQHVQDVIGTYLSEVSLVATLSGFSTAIYLPYSPVSSVASITYFDADNQQQTLAASVYNTEIGGRETSKVSLAYGQQWPSTYPRPDAVSISYTAGYAVAPMPIRQAVLMTAGHFYENREETIVGVQAYELPLAASRLLSSYREFSL